MNAFWDGFEKRAAEQSSEDKTNKKKYTGRGAVVGGALGAAGLGAAMGGVHGFVDGLGHPAKRNAKSYTKALRAIQRKEILKAMAIGGAGGAALGGLTGLGIGHAKDKVEKYKHENRHKNYGWFGWEDKRD